jgi:hypothetical protein
MVRNFVMGLESLGNFFGTLSKCTSIFQAPLENAWKFCLGPWLNGWVFFGGLEKWLEIAWGT